MEQGKGSKQCKIKKVWKAKKLVIVVNLCNLKMAASC